MVLVDATVQIPVIHQSALRLHDDAAVFNRDPTVRVGLGGVWQKVFADNTRLKPFPVLLVCRKWQAQHEMLDDQFAGATGVEPHVVHGAADQRQIFGRQAIVRQDISGLLARAEEVYVTSDEILDTVDFDQRPIRTTIQNGLR
ncbi:hypothetical protein GCM10027399_21820 [Curvibacter fontanus]